MATILSFCATVLGKWVVSPFEAITGDTALGHWTLSLKACDSVT